MSEIRDEQTWTEAVRSDYAKRGLPLVDAIHAAHVTWPLVAPLVTRARDARDADDEIRAYEDWSNKIADLLPNIQDSDDSQESLIEYAIRDLVTRADAVRDLHRRSSGPGCVSRCADAQGREWVYPCPTRRALDGES